MKLYGHELGTETVKPLRLREATIAADAATLRLLADFLVFVAERMEEERGAFGHEHFEDFSEAAPGEPSLVVTGPVVSSDTAAESDGGPALPRAT